MNTVVAVLATLCCLMIPCLSLCPEGWTRFEKKCYFKSESLATRELNMRYCQKLGGDLVTIKTKAENDFLRNFLKSNSNETFYWLSAVRPRIGVKEFKWGDGSEMKFSDWNAGEPNEVNRLRPICLDINPDNGWNDFLCQERLRQLCEKDVVIDCSTTEKVNEKDKDFLRKECPQMFFDDELRMKETEIEALKTAINKMTSNLDELKRLMEYKQSRQAQEFNANIEALSVEIEKLKKSKEEDGKCCEPVQQKTAELGNKLDTVTSSILLTVRNYNTQCEAKYQDIKKKVDDADKRLDDFDKVMEKKLFQWAKNIG